MIGYFSVCNRHQLPEAIALGESILAHHPESRFFLGFADKAALPALPDSIHLIPMDDLPIPFLGEMSTRYYDFEFVCATRPWFANHLINQFPAYSAWVFLGPTVQVYRSIETLVDDTGDLLLTPNITRPLPESSYLDDKRILNIGMFHSNAWIARPTPEVKKFLAWWSVRTIDRSAFDLCHGMCMDQLWLNYAPIHVPNWKLIRNNLWHVGLHNALHRAFSTSGELPESDGDTLYSIDFAGLQTYHPVWRDHTGLVQHDPEWKKLLAIYRHRLATLSAFRLEERPHYGRPHPISRYEKFKKPVKSELERIIQLIDKLEI